MKWIPSFPNAAKTLIGLSMAASLVPEKVYANAPSKKEMPVRIQADRLINNQPAQTITAEGQVEIVQGKRILRAERVEYNLVDNTAFAEGNVVLLEPEGSVYFADKLTLKDNLREGEVGEFKALLQDGARLTAGKGRRENAGNDVILEEAAYTPCIPCESTEEDQKKQVEENNPAWELKAKKVRYNKEEKTIEYEDMWFEFYDVPLLYTPYFSHPDGTQNQKSGFLSPRLGFDTELGTNITTNYYFALDPHQDLTAGLMVPTKEIPVLLGEYRRRFKNAGIEFEGSVTKSDRIDREGERIVRKEDEFRGHLFGEGRFDINKNWRAGFDVETTTDEQYLREYNITSKDILESRMFLEWFEGRNYFISEAVAFQDVRIGETQTSQPEILPQFNMNLLGDPGSVLGGRPSLDLSFLNLFREGSEQDVNRLSADLGWKGQVVNPIGMVTSLETSMRGDIYSIRDREQAFTGSGRSNDSFEVRGFTNAQLITRYPLIKDLEQGHGLIEPLIGLTVAPDIAEKETIPNEDSQDVQLDATNLFNDSRFPGYDRIEDQSKITYGLNTGLYHHNGNYIEAFAGQSIRFDEDPGDFPAGSGLSDKNSDYVGRMTMFFDGIMNVDYNIQLASDNLQSQRHELDAGGNFWKFDYNTIYFFSRGIEKTAVNENREQLKVRFGYEVNDQWYLKTGFTRDFGEEPGLREAFYGFDFTNECKCWSVSAVFKRNLTDDATGESETEFLLSFGLKNLGAFGTAN